MADISVNQGTPDPVVVLAALGLVAPSRITPVTGGADATIWRVGYERRGLRSAVAREPIKRD